jgi:hypothetical protein
VTIAVRIDLIERGGVATEQQEHAETSEGAPRWRH